ncbi:MAG: 30S ribosomal protein S6--L-glutamate ligase, partial [Bacteroidota bacterium]
MNLHILSMNAWLYSTRRLIEEAQHYGHQLQVISYKNVLCPSASPVLPDAVVPRIAANMTSNGLAAIRAYESMGIKSTLSSTTLELVRNKFACLQKLNSEGIPTP